MATHFSPGDFHGQRSPVGYSLQGFRELDTSERVTPKKISPNSKRLQSQSVFSDSESKKNSETKDNLKTLQIFLTYLFLLKDNYFTEFSCFLSTLNMNQP